MERLERKDADVSFRVKREDAEREDAAEKFSKTRVFDCEHFGVFWIAEDAGGNYCQLRVFPPRFGCEHFCGKRPAENAQRLRKTRKMYTVERFSAGGTILRKTQKMEKIHFSARLLLSLLENSTYLNRKIYPPKN